MTLLLLGGGGHAAMVIEALRAGGVEPMGIIERDRSSVGQELLGAPVIGADDDLEAFMAQGATHFVVTLGSVSTSTAREALFARAKAAGLQPLTVAHPTAWRSPSAAIEVGVTVGAGAIINAQARVGENAIINTAAVVEHDCVVGAHAHIAPGAILAASVVVGTGAHVGAGATVRQGVTIGARAVVGVGAAVVADVPKSTTVMGVPAKERAPRA